VLFIKLSIFEYTFLKTKYIGRTEKGITIPKKTKENIATPGAVLEKVFSKFFIYSIVLK